MDQNYPPAPGNCSSVDDIPGNHVLLYIPYDSRKLARVGHSRVSVRVLAHCAEIILLVIVGIPLRPQK